MEKEDTIRQQIMLGIKACAESIRLLNQILADAMQSPGSNGTHRCQVEGHVLYALPLQPRTARDLVAKLRSGSRGRLPKGWTRGGHTPFDVT